MRSLLTKIWLEEKMTLNTLFMKRGGEGGGRGGGGRKAVSFQTLDILLYRVIYEKWKHIWFAHMHVLISSLAIFSNNIFCQWFIKPQENKKIFRIYNLLWNIWYLINSERKIEFGIFCRWLICILRFIMENRESKINISIKLDV